MDVFGKPENLTDDEWAHVAPLIPPAKPGGNKRCVDVREVMNGIMYILSTGCQWRALPKDLPPKSTVHDYLGACMIAAGMLTFAAGAGEWRGQLSPNQLYFLGYLLVQIGLVVQDVVALAMSSEAVARVDADGAALPDDKVRTELGIVQALSQLALSVGYLAVAGCPVGSQQSTTAKPYS